MLEGEVDAWINGDLHRMGPGDLAAFPAGTGICHCFINNSEHEALLLVGGEAPKPGSRIFYPLNPSRRADMKTSDWWEDVPRHAIERQKTHQRSGYDDRQKRDRASQCKRHQVHRAASARCRARTTNCAWLTPTKL